MHSENTRRNASHEELLISLLELPHVRHFDAQEYLDRRALIPLVFFLENHRFAGLHTSTSSLSPFRRQILD